MATNNNVTVGLDFNVKKDSLNDIYNTLDKIIDRSKLLTEAGEEYGEYYRQAAVAAQDFKKILDSTYNKKLDQIDLTKTIAQIKQAYGSMSNFKQVLSQAGGEGSLAFKQLSSAVSNFKVNAAKTQTVLDKMAVTMGNTIRFGISSRVFNEITGSLEKSYSYVKKLDTSLNNIRIVSGQSAANMENFAKQANAAAKNLGTSTLDYTDAALIYYQQGLSEQEVIERTNTTIKMANALGASAQEVSDYMTAIWNNYAKGSTNLEYYADVITKLGAATASSAEEISQGLEKFASIGESVGLSYEYATAALATVTATTRQSADTVGTAFKTLFARIQGLNLGETLEDGTTLNKYSEALKKVGIDIKDQNGELKKMDTILEEMGSKWKDLSSDQQVALAQSVAGVRQYNQLMALMNQWDYMKQNLDVAYNSSGTLEEQQKIYEESTVAHLEKLGATLESIWSKLVDKQILNTLIDAIAGLGNAVDVFLAGLGGGVNRLVYLGNLLINIFQGPLAKAVDDIRAKSEETAQAFLAKSNLKEIYLLSEEPDWESAGKYGQDLKDLTDEILLKQQLSEEDAKQYEELKKKLKIQQNTLDIVKEINAEIDKETHKEKVGTQISLFEEDNQQAAKDAEKAGFENARKNLRGKSVETNKKYHEWDNWLGEQSLDNYNKNKGSLEYWEDEETNDSGGPSSGKLKESSQKIQDLIDYYEEIKKDIDKKIDNYIKENENLNAEDLQKLTDKKNEMKETLEALESAKGKYDNELSHRKKDETRDKRYTYNSEETDISKEEAKAIAHVGDLYKEDLETQRKRAQQTATMINNQAELNAKADEEHQKNMLNVEAQEEQVNAIQKQIDAIKKKNLEESNTQMAIAAVTTTVTSLTSMIGTISNFSQNGFNLDTVTQALSVIMIQSSLIAANAKKAFGFFAAEVGPLATQLLINKGIIAENEKMTALEATKLAIKKGYLLTLIKELALKVVEIAKEKLLVALDAIRLALKNSILALVMAIIAAAALLAIGVIALVKHWKENWTEAAKLQKVVEETTERVKELQEAYEELKNTVKNYKDAKDAISELKEGTVEFYEAIIKSNQAAQELIDTLGLVAGQYTIDANGLINIDEKAIEDAMYSEMQEIYRAQGENFQARAEVEKYNQEQIIKEFQKEVNKASKDAKISFDQAKEILDNASETNYNLGEIENRKYHPSQQPNYSSANLENTLSTQNLYQGQQLEAINNFSNNFNTFAKKEIDINEAAKNHLADYKDVTAKVQAYENQATLSQLRGYVSKEEEQKLSGYSSQTQQSIANILNQKRDKKTLTGGFGNNLDTDDYVWADNPKWYNPASWGAALGSKDQRKKFREDYAINAMGWTKNADGSWITDEGKTLKKKDAEKEIDKIDMRTAADAYFNDDYGLALTFEDIDKKLTNVRSTAKSKGLSETGSGYVVDAVAGLMGGNFNKELTDLMTNEEKQVVKDMLNQYKQTTTYSDGTQKVEYFTGIEGQKVDYSTEDLNKFLELSDEAGRSLERQKEDIKAYNSVLKAQAEELGTTQEALEFYGIALSKNDRLINEYTSDSAEAIAAQYKFNKKYNEAVKTFYDNEDAIKAYKKALNGTGDLSYDLADAMGELAKSLKEMGLSLSSETISEKLETVEKLLTGTKEEAEAAYNELINLARVDTLKTMFGPEADSQLEKYTYSYQQLADAIANTTPGEVLSSNYADALSKMITDTDLTIEQINQLADGLNIEIPVTYQTPEEFSVKDAEFTTAATATVHRYTGEMPNPAYDGKNSKTIQVDYAWVETTEAKTDHFLVPDKANMKVKNTKQNLGSFSKSLANQSAAKKSGGGDKKKNTSDEKADRYQEVNTQLNETAAILKSIQSETDKLFGKNLVENLNAQMVVLNREIDLTKKKLEIANAEMSEYRNSLANIYGMQFNADGSINQDSYVAIFAREQNRYTSAFTDDEAAKKRWEEFKKLITDYNTLVGSTIPNLEQTIRDDTNKKIEESIKIFNVKFDIALDLTEARKQWLDFKKDVIDELADENLLGQLTHYGEQLTTYFRDDKSGAIQTDLEKLKELKGFFEKMQKGDYNTPFADDEASLLDAITEAEEQLQDDLIDYEQLIDDIQQMYLQGLEVTADKFSDYLEDLEAITSTIDHQIKLLSYASGEKAYKDQAKFYDAKVKSIQNTIDFQTKELDFWKKQSEIATQHLKDAEETYGNQSEEYYTALAEVDKVREELDNATDSLLTSYEDKMDTLTSKFIANIEDVFQEFNKGLAGMDLDEANSQWELLNKNSEEYLDTINGIYGIQSLSNKYTEAINDATITAQNKLAKIRDEELKDLREKEKLSQYDLDRADLRYQIALKQIALEEAQQNKTTLRLRRDTQGNYTYQYTQDEDEITKLQNELSDLYNQLYNLDTGKYSENLEKVYSLTSEYEDKYKEILQDASLSEEERQNKLLELTTVYGELINDLTAQNEEIKINLRQSSLAEVFDLYNKDTENYTACTEEQREILNKYLSDEVDLTNSAYNTIFGIYDEAEVKFREIGNEEVNTLLNSVVPGWISAYQDIVDNIRGNGGFVESMGAINDELIALAQTYFNEVRTDVDKTNDVAEEYKETLKGIAEENKNIVSELESMLKAIEENQTTMANFVNAWDKIAKDAKDTLDDTNKAIDAYKTLQMLESGEAAENGSTGNNNTGNTGGGSGSGSGGSGGGTTNNADKVEGVAAAIWMAGSSVSGWGTGSTRSARLSAKGVSGAQAYINAHAENGDIYRNWANRRSELPKYYYGAFRTGGYTGDWNGDEGRVALLHKKELVLNAEDTRNLLAAIETLRYMTTSALNGYGAGNFGIGGNGLEQNVHIDANFPNVTNHNEIEEAINNLVNVASQRIHE